MSDNRTTPYFDKTANTGLTHFLNATRFSWQGLKAAVRREAAFRQEIVVLVLLTPLGLLISESATEFVLLMALSSLVLVVELLNSAIEAAVDRSGLEHNEFSGLAKDYGSAAVMLAVTIAGLTWLTFLVIWALATFR